MKCLLSVCLSVLAGVAIFAASKPEQTLAMQKGISVQMAASRHAAPVPEADQENAWVVTVTTDGRIYFGVEAVTPETLTRQMQIRPRNRAAKHYLKADAGAPFSSVRQVLHAARVDLFDDVVLLTSQPEPAQPSPSAGTIVPPKGLEVWIGTEAGSNLIAVQIGSAERSATLKINNESVAPAMLQRRLGQIFDDRADDRAGRVVVLTAAGDVPFAQVVRAIDASRAAGASRVSMPITPGV
jgi:biopolymer transport protein ExbD